MPEFLPGDIDWVSCLNMLLQLKYPHFQVSSWKSTNGEHCIAVERDLPCYDPSLGAIPGVSPVLFEVLSLDISIESRGILKVDKPDV